MDLTFEEFTELSEPLFEGINVDIKSKIVTFTDAHENYVNTSIKDNPSQEKNIISIFKRKKTSGIISDGNPLVHALKGNNGWSISDEDRNAIWDRVDEVLEKIESKYDLVVIAPSSNSFVKIFGDRVVNRFSIPVLEKCFMKVTKEEILDASPWKGFSEEEIEMVDKAMSKMDHWFESKYFPKVLVDKFQYNIVKIDPEFEGFGVIDGKNILVIDDVLSSGWSLKSCANVLSEHYFPESITLLTLFGKAE